MSSKKEEGPWESSGIMQCRQEVLYNSQADQKGHYCTRLYTSHYIFGQREKRKEPWTSPNWNSSRMGTIFQQYLTSEDLKFR